MVNILISVLIAIFFLGKTTKELQEKTIRASVFRTCVYLFLTIISFILFYKSYQVSNIVNIVNVRALRCAEDSLGHSKDTIKQITLYNNFHSLGSYSNKMMHFSGLNNEDSLFSQKGGVMVNLKISNSESDVIKERYTEDTANFGESPDFSNDERYYVLNFLSTSIPSFIPIFPKISFQSEWNKIKGSDGCLYAINSGDDSLIEYVVQDGHSKKKLNKMSGSEDLFRNGIIMQEHVIPDITQINDKSNFNFSCNNLISNSIDFLTAADISQYTYLINLNSDMYIQKLDVEYNIPIEISTQEDGLKVGSKGFTISGKLLRYTTRATTMIHVKLPTMANLQLIRSLIFTALLTTFFSFFCTNAFFVLRKWGMKYYRSHRLGFGHLRRISRRRVCIFKYFNYSLAFVFLIGFLFLAFLVANDTPIIMSYDNFVVEGIIALLIIIIVITVINYFLFKYSITPVYMDTKAAGGQIRNIKKKQNRHKNKTIIK